MIALARGERIGRTVVYALLFVIMVITLYPFWHVIMYSLSDSQPAMSGGLFLWPRELNFAAYGLMFRSGAIFTAYGNTVFRTGVGTSLGIVVTAMLAYPLSRRRLKGRNIITMGVFIPMLFQGGLIPLYLVVANLGLLNTRWALILPVLVAPYNVFIMRNYFQHLPDSLEESANIDGATPLRTLFSIIIPVSMPVIAAVAMFYGVFHWNYYIDGVLYIDQSRKQILQVFLRAMMSGSSLAQLNNLDDFTATEGMTEQTMLMATVGASMVPVLLVYPWLQKYYVKGVMIGSIKG